MSAEEKEAVDALARMKSIRTISKPGVKSEDEKIHEAVENLEKLKKAKVPVEGTTVRRLESSGKGRGRSRKTRRRSRKSKVVSMPKGEYLREHHHLFKVLRNPTRRALKAELRKQQKELKERGLR